MGLPCSPCGVSPSPRLPVSPSPSAELPHSPCGVVCNVVDTFRVYQALLARAFVFIKVACSYGMLVFVARTCVQDILMGEGKRFSRSQHHLETIIYVLITILYNNFDIDLTHLSSLASTTAITPVPCRVVYIVLIGLISAYFRPDRPTFGLVVSVLGLSVPTLSPTTEGKDVICLSARCASY